jgi:hypothetical protein
MFYYKETAVRKDWVLNQFNAESAKITSIVKFLREKGVAGNEEAQEDLGQSIKLLKDFLKEMEQEFAEKEEKTVSAPEQYDEGKLEDSLTSIFGKYNKDIAKQAIKTIGNYMINNWESISAEDLKKIKLPFNTEDNAYAVSMFGKMVDANKNMKHNADQVKQQIGNLLTYFSK